MMGALLFSLPLIKRPREDREQVPRAGKRGKDGVRHREGFGKAKDDFNEKLLRRCVIFRTSDEGSRKPA